MGLKAGGKIPAADACDLCETNPPGVALLDNFKTIVYDSIDPDLVEKREASFVAWSGRQGRGRGTHPQRLEKC